MGASAVARAIKLVGPIPGHAAALVVLALAFLVSRVIVLDRDLPPWSVAQLQPLDEFYYTISSFNLFRYGSVAHRVVDYVPTDAAPLSLLENAMTAITLMLFGNNYYGLRMASVFAGLGTLIILYVLLRRHLAPPDTSPSVLGLAGVLPVLLLSYLVADYAFDMAARVAEPSIFQILAMVLVLFAVSSWPRRKPSMVRAFSLACIAAGAWLFVYIFNFFVVPAVLLTLVVESSTCGIRRMAPEVLAAVAGCVAAAMGFALIVYLEYQQTLIQVYQMNIQGRGHSMLSSSGFGAAALHARALEILSTNIFRFDLPVLLAFELALPVFVYRAFRERDRFAFLVALLVAFLVLQFTIVPDAPQRKLVLLSPLVVLVVGMSIAYLRPFIAAVGSNRGAQAAILLWLAVAEFWFVESVRTARGSFDFGMWAVSALCVVSLGAVLLAALIGAGRFGRALATIGIASAILPGLYFSAEQIWMKPSYRYRDAMAAAAPYLNGRVVAGAYSYEFRLYNNSMPVLDPNLYLYSDMQGYTQYLHRLFSDGTAQCLVANADMPYASLGLKQVARFEIDAEDTRFMGVYCRGS
jgi:hypothetical protein